MHRKRRETRTRLTVVARVREVGEGVAVGADDRELQRVLRDRHFLPGLDPLDLAVVGPGVSHQHQDEDKLCVPHPRRKPSAFSSGTAV